MKKTLIMLFAFLMAVFGTACGERTDTSTPAASDVVMQITSRADSASTGEKFEEEIVKKATRPASDATEPAAAESETKAKKKKKKSKQLPTQGDVNPNAENIQVTTQADGSFDESDLEFVFEGAYIYLGDDIDDALAILGDDNSAEEISKTKTGYEYTDLYLISYIKDGTEKVEQITVTTDKLSTSKGAKVGMYATKLRAVYGVPNQKSDSAWSYTIGSKSLVFSIENNIVSSYSYVLKH